MYTTSGRCQHADGAPDTTRHNKHRTRCPLGCVFACRNPANRLRATPDAVNSPDTTNAGHSEQPDTVNTGR
eukprot:15439965-Alexandrium_andersonii.AAC.1